MVKPVTTRTVIGELSLGRLLIPVAVTLGLLLAVTWAGAINGFWLDGSHSRDASRIVLIIACAAGLFFLTCANVVSYFRHGGAALYLRDGKLFHIGRGSNGFGLSEIVRVSFGPEIVFEGLPNSITFHLATGGRATLETFGLRTPFAEVVNRLKALGVPAEVPQR